jgi:Flp pilus assembly protein TadB
MAYGVTRTGAVAVSKQRAQKRSQQQAVQRQEAKAARETKQARSRQRRAERAKAGRGRGRIGYAGLRRSRRQRIGITVVTGGAIAVLWLFTVLGAVDVGLAIALTVLLLVALPAFVVLALGRRY